jgi:hypothetical protein
MTHIQTFCVTVVYLRKWNVRAPRLALDALAEGVALLLKEYFLARRRSGRKAMLSVPPASVAYSACPLPNPSDMRAKRGKASSAIPRKRRKRIPKK